MDPIELIREGKIQRYFRATRKLNVPNLVLHITQRAAGREPLFIEDDDYLAMLVLLKEVSERYVLRIFAFCLMPNHLHLLFSTTAENLYDAMKFLFSRYAMRFNKKYERKGHLFAGPYRQAVCLDDSYLLAASLYIHLNPLKAGLARDALRYRWSSYRLYHEEDPPRSFVDPNFILEMLVAGDQTSARKMYRDLLLKGRNINTEDILERDDSIARFRFKLDAFISKFLNRADGSIKTEQLLGLDVTSNHEIQKLIEEARGGKWQRTPASRQANKYLVEQLLARGYKRAEIGERLGMSRKTIYNILQSSA